MGKKKKGGKEKGDKGGGGEKKLPPPPNLDDRIQGAHEALLTFKIHGKEEMIGQYQEEAEVCKERNYHQKEQNYHLKVNQAGHYETLVRQAREYEEEEERKEMVGKKEVEMALQEKLAFARHCHQDLLDLEARVCAIDQQLDVGRAELEKWQRYKEVIQHERAAYIAAMQEKMDEMAREEAQLQREMEGRLACAMQEVEERSKVMVIRQQERISKQMLEALDKDSRAELSDNAWLNKEIVVVQERLKKLREETDALELRNLKLTETVYRLQMDDLEATREVYRSSIRRSDRSVVGGGGSPGGSSLPSLVDVKKSTAEEGPGGQLGQMELQLLSVEGARVSLTIPPETVHLPPIEEQRCTHTALPPRTSWPVTSTMLKSFV